MNEQLLKINDQLLCHVLSFLETLPIPSVLPSSGYDKLYPKKDEEEGLDLAADKDNERIPGTIQVFHMAAAKDQENKVHEHAWEGEDVICCCML